MKSIVPAIISAVFLLSCANESDPEADKSFFVRIYDNNKFNVSYSPLDVQQTSDGGYLILGSRRIEESNFKGIYLMKADALGSFVSDQELETDLVNPAAPLLELNGKLYFFCMTSVGLQTQLIEVNETGEITQTMDIGGTYPAAAAMDDDHFLLLNYDIDNKASVISRITMAGEVTGTKGFSIGAGDAVEEPIINHFIRTGKQIPFQVGKTTSGLYYFNGFYNYTLSVVFTDLSADDPAGVIQGQQDDGGISHLIPTSGGKYAAARFNFGDNYFLPSVTLSSTSISSSVDLAGNYLPELIPDAPVVILKTTINGKEALLYGSNTKGKQIALFGYDPADGFLLGSRYIGFSNTFEIAALSATKDNGIVVCGTTYVAGRFPRICLFKLSAEELGKSFKR